ncbi:MAG: OmpA family protein [Sphingobacteriales bacterium]|nr:MAG: OmpA family protein [Sphingobacteriales bacterium]
MIKLRTITTLIIAGGMLSGCSTIKSMNNTEKGAVIGAGGGAVAGGVIGQMAGKNPALGAVIGTVVGGAAGALIGRQMDKQAREIEQTVPGVDVERVGEGIVVNFSEKILFDVGKSALSSQSHTALDKLVIVLNKYADTDLKVYGHTDNTGTEASNQTLSERRSSAVSNYLASKGISRSRLKTFGYGETTPKCENETAAGKACNRRVEFAITANAAMKDAAEREAGQ